MNQSAIAIERVEIRGIHGHQTVPVTFNKGLNIIHGKNGSGKTTLLHVITNLLEKDLERFCHLNFHKIFVRTFGGTEIILSQEKKQDRPSISLIINGEPIGEVVSDLPVPINVVDALKFHLGGRPVYLPAFRSILEGSQLTSRSYQYRDNEEIRRELDSIAAREREFYASSGKPELVERSYLETIALKTVLCRKWFGKFVPTIRYPSIPDVNREIEREQREARYQLALSDQATLSTIFVQVLQTVLFPKNTEEANAEGLESSLLKLKTNLGNLERQNLGLPHIYSKVSQLFQGALNSTEVSKTTTSAVLQIYNEALSERGNFQSKLYSALRTFSDSVNRFLEGKRIDTAGPAIKDAFSIVELDGGRRAGLNILSSGERHVLTLLFAATHMSSYEGIVLIDEPELSLHLDWQRMILAELTKQAGSRQIIACTHSAEVAADHREHLIELVPTLWQSNEPSFDFVDTGDSTSGDDES